MSNTPSHISTDLRGLGKLTIAAVTGIADIVESLHQTIISCSWILSPSRKHRTRGITGMIYRNIHKVSELAGGSIDAVLERGSAMIGDRESSPRREALIAALNGVLGDYLAETENPLAVPMQVRSNGRPLKDEDFLEAVEQTEGRLLILVHGLCMNDLQWERRGHDHGAALASELGLTPVYVHYNTGLHISENGRQLSDLLETLTQKARRPLTLFILAHSMGGLVSRSACHYGKTAGHTWMNHLQKIIFLGAPHHGALLEKSGNWFTLFLEISPYSAPFSRLGKIRSCGITDLRYGSVSADDWQGRDRFAFSGDRRVPVPLPEGVQCYAIAVTKGKASGKLNDDLVGDGFVTVSSAMGHHKNPERRLLFPETHKWIGRHMAHMDLLNHPEVYEVIKEWVKE